MRPASGPHDERIAFQLESSVVKEVASLGMIVVVALLFLAFLTNLRPRAIAAVQGDMVMDVAPMKRTLADSKASARSARSPQPKGGPEP